MDHLVFATLAVFAGSVVEGVLGFGCSLVWMSFFPLFTTVPDAVGVLQPMHILLNILLLVSIWKQSKPKELKPLALTVPFGIVFGLWIVTSWSSNAIDFVLGIFLIVYTFLKKDEEEPSDLGHDAIHGSSSTSGGVGKDFKRKTSDLELEPLNEVTSTEEKKDDISTPMPEEIPQKTTGVYPLTHRQHVTMADGSKNKNPKHRKRRVSRKKKNNMMRNPTAICAGLVGGALMGAFGTGGPAFLIFAREAGWQKRPEIFRANLQLLFFVINVPCCLSQFAEGIITLERCKASCYLVPALVAGGYVGRVMAVKVSREKFQILVVNGLRIMGVMFLIEATR